MLMVAKVPLATAPVIVPEDKTHPKQPVCEEEGAEPNVSGGPRVTEPVLLPRVMADDTLSPIKTAVAPLPTFTVPNADVPVFPILTVVAAALLFPTLTMAPELGPTVTFPLPVAPSQRLVRLVFRRLLRLDPPHVPAAFPTHPLNLLLSSNCNCLPAIPCIA